MTIYRAVYRVEGFAPRSEQPDLFGAGEVALLHPRAGAAHNDPFQLSTKLEGDPWKPWLQAPRGRRMVLKLPQRTGDIGAMSFVVGDPKVASDETERWFAQFLANADDTNRLLNCLFRVYESLDDGCTFRDYFTGRLQRARRIAHGVWQVDLRDLAEDFRRDIFVTRPARSLRTAIGQGIVDITPLIPHQHTSGFGRWGGAAHVRAKKLADVSGLHRFAITPWNPPDSRWGLVGKAMEERATEKKGFIPQLGRLGAVLTFDRDNVKAYVKNTSTAAEGEFWLRRVVTNVANGHVWAYDFYVEELAAGSELHATWASLGGVNAPLEFQLFAIDKLGGQVAVLLSEVHPVKLLADLCDGLYGQMKADGSPSYPFRRDPTNPIWAQLIGDLSIGVGRWIVPKTVKFDEWVPDNLLKSFHLAYYIDESGYLVPVDMRPKAPGSVPVITDDDLFAVDDSELYETDLKDAITRVDVSYYGDERLSDFYPAQQPGPFPDLPPGLLRSTEHVADVPARDAEVRDLGLRPMVVKAGGLRYTHDATTVRGQQDAFFKGQEAARLAQTLLGQYLRGPKVLKLRCRRTAVPAGTRLGDLRTVKASDTVSPDSLLYDWPVLGRCIEKTEDREEIRLVFELAGLGTPGSPGTPKRAADPTLGIPVLGAAAANGHSIDVPVTLNADGDLVELAFAITDQTVAVIPAEADPAWTYAGTVSATATVNRAPFPGGMRVWWRARSNPLLSGQFGLLPSDWVFPNAGTGYVDTTAVPGVGALSVTPITGDTADVAWPGGTTGRMVQIALHTGAGVVFPDAEIIDHFVMPPRNTRLFGLTPSTQYTVGVREVDEQGGLSAWSTHTFMTTGAASTIRRPAGIDFVYWSAITVQVFPSEPNYDLQIERAPDDGTGAVDTQPPYQKPGAPVTGSAVQILIPRSGTYDDPLPADYTIHWYRARHVSLAADGVTVLNASGWTGWFAAIARPLQTVQVGGTQTPFVNGGAPSTVVVPVRLPTFSTTYGTVGPLAILTLLPDDPQGRIERIEFQTQEGTNPPSAWTMDPAAPYQASVLFTQPDISTIRWRAIGFDAGGAPERTLGQGEQYFGGGALTVAAGHVVGASWDGKGAALDLNGTKLIRAAATHDGVIQRVRVTTVGGVGNATIGVKACSQADFLSSPGNLVDITGGSDVVLAGDHGLVDGVLTGWTATGVIRGDVFEFELKAVGAFHQLTIQLEYA